MKSKKLISLLLSAALAVSSLPMMMATAVGAADAEKENLLDLAELTVAGTAELLSDEAESGNGYLHVGNRTNRDTALYYTIGALDAGTYYISFDARASVASKHEQWLRVRTTTQNTSHNSYTYWLPTDECTTNTNKGSIAAIKLTTDWNHYELKLSSDAAISSTCLNMYAFTDSRYCTPYDIDNFSFYAKDENGNKVQVLNYMTQDFDDRASAFGGGIGQLKGNAGAVLTALNGGDYTRVTPNADEALVYTYSFGEDGLYLDSGVYALDGEIRYGYFHDLVFSDLDGAEGTGASAANIWKNGSSYTGTIDGVEYANKGDGLIYKSAIDAVVTAVIDGEEYVLAALTPDTKWTALDIEPIDLPEGGTLTEIKVTTDKLVPAEVNSETYPANPDAPVDFRNFSLTAVGSDLGGIYEAADPDNALDGAVVSYTGTVETTEAEGYLYVPERTSDTSTNFLDIRLPVNPKGGVTYYFGADVRMSDGGSIPIRPYVNFAIKEAVAGYYFENGMNGNYLVPSAGLTQVPWSWNATAAPVKYFPTHSLSADWTYLEGYFTPNADGNSNPIIVSFNRGASGNQIQAIDVDNIAVWYYDGDTKVVVYENDLNAGNLSANGGLISSSRVAVEAITTPGVTGIIPNANGVAGIAYDISELGYGAGDYFFEVALESASEAVGDAYLVITYADGTVEETEAVTVDADGAFIAWDKAVEPGDDGIESIEVITDLAGGLVVTGEYLTYNRYVIIGDANGNERTTSVDLVYLQRYLASWDGYDKTKVNVEALDLNEDEIVNLTDAAILARHLAKWIGYDVLPIVSTVDTANDTYAFVGKNGVTATADAQAFGLPAEYSGVYYEYANSAVDLDTGNMITVYSEIKLGNMRVYRIDENNVIYQTDALTGCVLDSSTHYSTNHWLAGPATTSLSTTRNYVKYGITDMNSDGKVNFADYKWCITNTAEAVAAKREAYAAQLTAIVEAAVENGTADYSSIINTTGNRTAVQAFLEPYIALAKADEAWEITFADVPSAIHEVELATTLISAEFVEGKLVVETGSDVIVDLNDNVTELIVVNQNGMNIWTGEDAITVLSGSPQVAYVGKHGTADSYGAFYAKLLADGIAVFMVGYNNTDC